MKKKRSKTLAIISPGFPADESDSTCLPTIQNFVGALNKNFPSLNIVIVSLQYPYRNSRYIWNQNLVIPLNGKWIPKIFRLWFWVKAYFQLCKIHRQNKLIGVLSLWCLETAVIGNFFTKRKKVKHFIWIHGQDARKKNPFISLIKPKAHELVALSEFLVAEFERNHRVKPQHIIPNGIDRSLFKDPPQTKDIDILGAGSLIPLKQYSVFIKVVKGLAKIKSDLQVVLVGAGPEESQLKKQISDMGLEKNITMMGEIPHGEVIKKMQQSKIFLHPSAYEGYSTVCLEALYAGCHVVSFIAAENRKIEHWHIVKDTNEMVNQCKHLLFEQQDYTPVLVHGMDESARVMMQLYNYRDTTE